MCVVTRLVVAAVAVLGIAVERTTAQTIWTVAPGTPVSSIQQAIGLASNGDTIRVRPGSYLENLNYSGKAIRIESTDGPNATQIDGRGLGSTVRFAAGEGPSSILRGFRITGGAPAPGGGPFAPGSGISIDGASPTIEECVIYGNRGADGPPPGWASRRGTAGGINAVNSGGTVRNCRIALNIGGNGSNGRDELVYPCGFICSYPPTPGNLGGPGGIQVDSGPGFTVVNTWIVGNLGGGGGAGGRSLYAFPAQVGGNGGAGAVFAIAGRLVNCTIAANVGGSPGATGTGLIPSGFPPALAGPGALDHYSLLAQLYVDNCIVWGNALPWIVACSAPNGNCANLPIVRYSIVPDLAGIAGTNAIAADPQFFHPPSGDFHLVDSSPARNAGSNALVFDPFDIDREPRVYEGAVDIGGDEWLSGGFGGARRVLSANGSFDVLTRLGIATPLTLAVDPPPGAPSAHFVLAWADGLPGPAAGTFFPGMGPFAIPLPDPFASPPAILATSMVLPVPSMLAVPPAPWMLTLAGGLPIPATLTLQGIVQDGAGFSTTNAIVLSVQ